MDLFNRKFRDSKQIAQRISKLLSQKNFYNDLISKHGNNYDYYLGSIIEYYISTNDKKANYSVDEISELMFQDYGLNTVKYMENPILAHACNGYNMDYIRKFGLGHNSFWDSSLEEKFQYLEKVFGISALFQKQNNLKSEFYFTTPGNLVVDYAMYLSPERLFLGILKQEEDDSLPLKVGESKTDYYKRVIDNKLLKLNVSQEEIEKVKNYAYLIIDKLCSKRPLVILFPTKSKKHEILARVISSGNGEKKPINEWLYDGYFNHSYATLSGGSYSSNDANLVTDNTIVKPNELGIISIPDYFEMLQIKSKEAGMASGDEIDIYTGQKYESRKIDKSSLRPIYLGGTGEMYEFEKKGKKFLYKPSVGRYSGDVEPFRGMVQECAYKVQKIVDPNSAVECHYFESDDLCGTVQDKIDVNSSAPNYYKIQSDNNYSFTKFELEQFMREFITDYLLCNFDSHGGNFIVGKDGLIRGIDKEQSFKYISDVNSSRYNINYNPNMQYGEQETIYNYIFKRYIKGELELDFNIFDKYIYLVESIGNDYYSSIFKDYCDSCERSLGVDSRDLLEKILLRKQNLRKSINEIKNYLVGYRNSFSNIKSKEVNNSIYHNVEETKSSK